MEGPVAARRSPSRCAGWAPRATGGASTSRWTRSSRRVVTETFVRLYEQGLIYRGKRLVNWDPVLQTAVSDLEVESEEEDGNLWHITLPFARRLRSAAGGHVATTRPETMLGDTAVAVHPEDERYKHLIGKPSSLPLTGPRDPGHRRRLRRPGVRHRVREDHAGARLQRLPGRPAARAADDQRAHARGKVNDNAPPRYRGLDRFVARKRSSRTSRRTACSRRSRTR